AAAGQWEHDDFVKWDGFRELDGWMGDDWERFRDAYDPEFHETGHHFHVLGDLYIYPVTPSHLKARYASGQPVQLQTRIYGRDLPPPGSSRGASARIHHRLIGFRPVIRDWWRTGPAALYARILDRDGNPVPDALVELWLADRADPVASGRTDAVSGAWDTTYPFGPWHPDPYHGLPEHESPLGRGWPYVFRVEKGGYEDVAILGRESEWGHSHFTLAARAYENPDAYVWDFKTLYHPSAPAPTFRASASVSGTAVVVAVESVAGHTYRLYRRSPPG